jgi:hypothetical protein
MSELESNLKTTLRLLAVAMILTVFGCNQTGEDRSGSQGSIHTADKGETRTAKFQDEKVSAVYHHYLHVKDALVQSDSKEARLGSAALRTALLEIGHSNGAAVAEKITKTASVEAQREQLNSLTTELEGILKKSPIASGEVYKQFCPMANEGNGGYWFSSDPAIRNPYYGDEMLDCGEVKDVIR